MKNKRQIVILILGFTLLTVLASFGYVNIGIIIGYILSILVLLLIDKQNNASKVEDWNLSRKTKLILLGGFLVWVSILLLSNTLYESNLRSEMKYSFYIGIE